MPDISFVLQRPPTEDNSKPKKNFGYNWNDSSGSRKNKRKKKVKPFYARKQLQQEQADTLKRKSLMRQHSEGKTKNTASQEDFQESPGLICLNDERPTSPEWNAMAHSHYKGNANSRGGFLEDQDLQLLEESVFEVEKNWIENTIFDFLAIDEEEDGWKIDLEILIELLTNLDLVRLLSRTINLNKEQQKVLGVFYFRFFPALKGLSEDIDSLASLDLNELLQKLDLSTAQCHALIDKVSFSLKIEAYLFKHAHLLSGNRLGYLLNALRFLGQDLQRYLSEIPSPFRDDLQYDHEWAYRVADQIGLTEEQQMRFPYFIEDSESIERLGARLRMTWDQERQCRELLE